MHKPSQSIGAREATEDTHTSLNGPVFPRNPFANRPLLSRCSALPHQLASSRLLPTAFLVSQHESVLQLGREAEMMVEERFGNAFLWHALFIERTLIICFIRHPSLWPLGIVALPARQPNVLRLRHGPISSWLSGVLAFLDYRTVEFRRKSAADHQATVSLRLLINDRVLIPSPWHTERTEDAPKSHQIVSSPIALR